MEIKMDHSITKEIVNEGRLVSYVKKKNYKYFGNSIKAFNKVFIPAIVKPVIVIWSFSIVLFAMLITNRLTEKNISNYTIFIVLGFVWLFAVIIKRIIIQRKSLLINPKRNPVLEITDAGISLYNKQKRIKHIKWREFECISLYNNCILFLSNKFNQTFYISKKYRELLLEQLKDKDYDFLIVDNTK